MQAYHTVASNNTLAESISLYTSLLACVAIIFIGLRFLFLPKVATAGFGVSTKDMRAFTAIKGVRDIASGIAYLTVWRGAGQQALGWVMVAAAFTPIGDMMIVLSRGGQTSVALGVHGSTAAVLVVAGLVLARS